MISDNPTASLWMIAMTLCIAGAHALLMAGTCP